MAERDYEEEAVEQGWNSDGPLNAQEFVEKGEKIVGIVKKHNTELKGRIEALEASNREFGKDLNTRLTREKAKNEQLLSQLETERAAAITDGDGQRFTKLDNEIAQVRHEISAPLPDVDSWNAQASQWVASNNWYNTNPKLQAYADGISDRLKAQGYQGQAYWDELTRSVKEDFPEEFGNKNRAKPNGVEAGGQKEKIDSEAHTYENLDKEAQTACDKYIKNGLTTKEEYLANYEW